MSKNFVFDSDSDVLSSDEENKIQFKPALKNQFETSSDDSEKFNQYLTSVKKKPQSSVVSATSPTALLRSVRRNSIKDFIVSDDESDLSITDANDQSFYLEVNKKLNQSSVIFSSSSSSEADSSEDNKSSSSDSWFDVTSDSESDVREKEALKKISLVESLHLINRDDISKRRLHPETEKFVKAYRKHFKELTMTLWSIFNGEVFDTKLPADPHIEWNPRLLKTAGQCVYKRIKITQGQEVEIQRIFSIQLSTKVLTTADRLRDTLLHEACHAYVWVVHGLQHEGHGPNWKAIAQKAMNLFPHIPRVTRCHAYTIATKFTYICSTEGCGARVNRHTKSLDTTRKVCARCKGKFILMRNIDKGPSMKMHPVEKNALVPLTPFAAFVKTHYKDVRQTPLKELQQGSQSGTVVTAVESNKHNPSHAEAMKVLGDMFRKMKMNENKSNDLFLDSDQENL